MRFPGVSRSPLSPRKRIALIIAVAASALLGGTLAAVAAGSNPGGWPVTGQALVPVPGQVVSVPGQVVPVPGQGGPPAG